MKSYHPAIICGLKIEKDVLIMKKIKQIVLSILALLVAVVLVACGQGQEGESADSEPVEATEEAAGIYELSVGVVGENAQIIWEDIAERVADKNIELEVIQFSDYNQPNEALAGGDLDLNAFQHVAFLEDFNASTDNDLEPVGYTFISPMGIYSEQVSNVDEIQDGDTIGIPNDVTNGGRAILFLEQLGYITLADGHAESPTTDDIEEYNIDITIEAVDAAQLPRTLPDVTAAIINTNFAVDAGYIPQEDALQLDTDDMEAVSEYYKNVIVVTPDNIEEPWVQPIVEAYQTDRTAELISETTAGADVPAWSEDDNLPGNSSSEE